MQVAALVAVRQFGGVIEIEVVHQFSCAPVLDGDGLDDWHTQFGFESHAIDENAAFFRGIHHIQSQHHRPT